MHEHLAGSSVEPLSAPFLVADNFLPSELAQAMRKDIEEHIANPHRHEADTHQIWNYWFVRGLYTYLRTRPENVIGRTRVEAFLAALRDWSIERLGLGQVSWPYLSMYVSGCSQGLHNDSKNGRFAFVYSLTRDERQTIGGSTIVLREGDLFRRNLAIGTAGTNFYELIEARFNRLVVFDDRLLHGVERVDGSMDPAHARWVLHGHIEEAGPITAGPLPIEALREGICSAMDRFVAARSAAIQLYHGPLVLRFRISAAGEIAEIRIVLDRVFAEQEGNADWEELRAELLRKLGRATFPTSSGETTVTLPITFGSPLRSSQT